MRPGVEELEPRITPSTLAQDFYDTGMGLVTMMKGFSTYQANGNIYAYDADDAQFISLNLQQELDQQVKQLQLDLHEQLNGRLIRNMDQVQQRKEYIADLNAKLGTLKKDWNVGPGHNPNLPKP